MAQDQRGQGGPDAPEPAPNGPARARWLIYSREHTAFWRPLRAGYTPSLDEAGRYTTAEAWSVGASGAKPHLVMLLAPECAPGAAVLLESLSEADQVALTAFMTTTKPDATSHGALDLGKLVAMLLQDVALMIHRPGSWEGAGMRDLMAGHGYYHWQHDAICEAVRREYWKGKDPYATGAYGAGGPRTPRKP